MIGEAIDAVRMVSRLVLPGRAVFVVDINPGLGAINGRFQVRWTERKRRGQRRPRRTRQGTPVPDGLAAMLCTSKDYEAYKSAIAKAAREAASRSGCHRIGVLEVWITEYWPRRHKTLAGLEHVAAPVGLGDVDAPIKATLDGMEDGGLIDTDARVVELHVRKRYDRSRPRVAVAVRRVSDYA